MIIEYRFGSNPSTVIRTYKDVENISRDTGDTVHLFGKTKLHNERIETSYTPYYQNYFIAAIHLAPGEYIERVDLPRD
jgi:hypothetical protein